MINILRKIFIKDYKNVLDKKVREKHGILASIFGLLLNVILVVLKLIFGFISHSTAIIGDAINNLTDTFSGIIALFGYKLSAKDADEEHPFGHQRIEYIATLIISIIVLIVGFEIIFQAIEKVINHQIDNVTFSPIVLGVLGISILIKLIQGFFYLKMSKIIESLTLKATAIDSFSDVISTLIILIGGLISYVAHINVDVYLSIVVGLIIIYNAASLIKDVSTPLIGGKPDYSYVNKILQDIRGYSDKVIGIHDVMCHQYGPTKMFLTLHVEVSQYDSFVLCHEIIDDIERYISKKYNIEIVIHMDPVDNKDQETIELKQLINDTIKQIDEKLSIHDFRLVKGQHHTNVLFDIVYDKTMVVSKEDILSQIEAVLPKKPNHKFYLKVNFDSVYYKETEN